MFSTYLVLDCLAVMLPISCCRWACVHQNYFVTCDFSVAFGGKKSIIPTVGNSFTWLHHILFEYHFVTELWDNFGTALCQICWPIFVYLFTYNACMGGIFPATARFQDSDVLKNALHFFFLVWFITFQNSNFNPVPPMCLYYLLLLFSFTLTWIPFWQVRLYYIVDKTVANSDKTYKDVEPFLELCWNFEVLSVSLSEEYLVCCSHNQVQGIIITYAEVDDGSPRLVNRVKSPVSFERSSSPGEVMWCMSYHGNSLSGH